MTGLLTKLDRPLIRARGRFDPNLILDLPFVPSASIQPFRGTATIFSRSSVATCLDSIGFLRQIGADVPCFDHDRADNFAPLGIRIEGQSINEIRNNMMAGANPATDILPTHWDVAAGFSGIMDITDAGTENGMAFIELRFNGTPSADANIRFEDQTQIAALQNEVWTLSTYWKLVAGDFTNMNGARIQITERSSGGAALTTHQTGLLTPTSSVQRIALTKTLTQATTAFVDTILRLDHAAAGAVDFTLRLYLPQCEKQAFATSPIETSVAAAARTADVLTGTLTGFPSAGALVCLARAADGGNAADATLFHAEASTSSNLLQVWRRSNDDPRVSYRTAGGATSTVDIATAWADDTDMRIAVGWDKDRVQMSVDQATPIEVTHTGVVFDEAPSALSFGHDKALTGHLGGSLNLFRLYNAPMFDGALQAL